MSDESSQPASEVTRRVVLRGAAVTGVAVPFLAACGSDDKPADSGGKDDSSGKGSSGKDSSGPLASTSDVPVGQGTVLKEEQIVLTQPTEGDFKAFTAVCTHQGCTVNEVSDGIIHCPCHGSQYSVEDGSVVGGPAPEPLAAIDITVDGDQIIKG